MKQYIKRCLICTAAAALLCICSGCSGSGGTSAGTNTFLPGTNGGTAPAQTPAASTGYTGTWVHTYEYFDTQYKTTLIISPEGTAAFYNDDAGLGNFTATWQDTGSGIIIYRSDGVQSQAVLSGGTLIETTYENGAAYQAEYYRTQ